MRTAILSDIHGNLEALEAVFGDLEDRAIDRMVSLGDNVGYGPDPAKVLQRLSERGVPSVLGNHELGLVNASFLSWFNATARRSLLITRRLLSPESLEQIRTFGRTLKMGSALFVHGCPPDSVTRYFFEVYDSEWRQIFSEMAETICFVGHTHELGAVEYDGVEIAQHTLSCGVFRLRADRRYVVNAGSVGQPRDGDRRAKYLIWDDEDETIEVRCVPYAVERTVEKVLELGFPEINARRLL